MSQSKPEIKYTIPEIKIDFNENNSKNELPCMNKFFNQFENIENLRNNSLIYSEISKSKLCSQSKIMNSQFLLHNGIKCEKCQTLPIRGYRYKCPKCLNYNLCQECEELNADTEFHPHSNFILCRNPETSLTTNEFSYTCLTPNLEIHQKYGVESFNIKIKIKNTGCFKWPQSASELKCRKEKSTIFCNKYILPSIDINEETDVVLSFNKCSKIPKGKYLCYVNCIINEKVRGGLIEIKVFIE